ncbi:folate synthesis bifunctional protein, mitochondrial-like isoform X1 [Oryza glaberrima]|nr:folate synthesis bifunctional protein, mitochondrial-like isoform X1 [Oryza glaberrima]XP_052162916.1 folate synthesis bifunctional protein, mitochondrial-like isoform X1 [Oryza glaberrima]XP_052162917.1 folate synthesis bifunctional protein, mitochondrial-like isoform X1 [Oryza glaberrima]XP_052162918.1 folate synthesis bifunctional protein, mitochondrial-like isoform X1 [Oryza glaberrima]XP_052162919.1 folate synthesis bifunctional protein, mitochondrial-like isoform X1 [Oryza glaberrima]
MRCDRSFAFADYQILFPVHSASAPREFFRWPPPPPAPIPIHPASARASRGRKSRSFRCFRRILGAAISVQNSPPHICLTMLRAKETFRKMYSVAKNYCGGGLAASDALSGAVSALGRSLKPSRKASRHVVPCRARSFTQCSLGGGSADQEIVIALGSNVGDRISTFDRALRMMKNSGVNITRHACLYETSPAYVTDQPRFLNSAVRGTTKLEPHELLKKLKEIEKDIGRTDGIRYGPRPIDLDILLYGKSHISTENLTVPHERIHERPFVLAPLVDLLGSSTDDNVEKSWHSLAKCTGGFFESWDKLGGESIIGTEGIKRVLPVGNRLLDWSERTLVMGVLNLTPDSFSDGGKFQEVEAAIAQTKLLISEGADIIDIGAQSTRPLARRLSADEELERLVPVLDAITGIPEMEGKLLSVDTFYAEVAAEAVKRGVHIVNDVSGGQIDPRILEVVAELGVPYVTMHMRGDPSTMQSEQNLLYGDVCKEVASELYKRVRQAELSGIPLWRIVLDPGIGFSKNSKHNLEVIMGLESIRTEIGKMSLGASHVPILLGPSRKRFLGEICNRVNPTERDAATMVVATAGILNGANIVRVHNVKYGVDTAKVSDALSKGRR